MKLQLTIRTAADRRFAKVIAAVAESFYPDRVKIKRGQDPRHPGTEIVYIRSIDPEKETV